MIEMMKSVPLVDLMAYLLIACMVIMAVIVFCVFIHQVCNAWGNWLAAKRLAEWDEERRKTNEAAGSHDWGLQREKHVAAEDKWHG